MDAGERLISDKKLEKEERESYKNSFLTKLFEKSELALEDKEELKEQETYSLQNKQIKKGILKMP